MPYKEGYVVHFVCVGCLSILGHRKHSHSEGEEGRGGV